MKYQNAEIKTGLFVLLSGAAFLGLFIWLSGYVNALIRPQSHYYTRLADAEGLESGAKITFAGITAGQLVSLSYHPGGIPEEHFADLRLNHVEGKGDNLRLENGVYRFVEDDGRYVLIVYTVENRFKDSIGLGATIEVRQPIFGGATMNIRPGPADASAVGIGGYIPGENSVMAKIINDLGRLKERFSRVSDQIENVLINVGRLTSEDGSLDKTLVNFEKVSSNLIELSTSLRDRVEGMLSDETIASVAAAVASMERFMEQIESATGTHLEPTLANLEAASARFDALLGENQERIASVLSAAETSLRGFEPVGAKVEMLVDELRLTIADPEGVFQSLSGNLTGTLSNADALIADVRARVAEFKWSYLHYLIFAPSDADVTAGRVVDLGRELVIAQEQSAAAIARIDQLLLAPGQLETETRVGLEDHRRELNRQLERSNELQRLLFERLESSEKGGAKR